MSVLRCATTNPGKLREFNMAAGHFGFHHIEILALDGLKALPECVEDGLTFEQNAVKKALHYSAWCEEPLFADDSGLEVDCLAGAPGVYSARYSGPAATDESNNRLLLDNVRGEAVRTARFVCVIAAARKGKLIGTFRGAVEGRIVDDARGPNGFGYDPLFYYEPFGCTFGEADAAAKMNVSHRGQALKAMLTSLCGGPATSSNR
jgi:XTP/dITP diphosphohydrolase